MVSFEDACRCLEDYARPFIGMTCDELGRLADLPPKELDQYSEYVPLGDQEAFINVSISRVGWVWRCVEVDITLTIDNAHYRKWRRVPWVWFQRYASGKTRGDRLSEKIQF